MIFCKSPQLTSTWGCYFLFSTEVLNLLNPLTHSVSVFPSFWEALLKSVDSFTFHSLESPWGNGCDLYWIFLARHLVRFWTPFFNVFFVWKSWVHSQNYFFWGGHLGSALLHSSSFNFLRNFHTIFHRQGQAIVTPIYKEGFFLSTSTLALIVSGLLI